MSEQRPYREHALSGSATEERMGFARAVRAGAFVAVSGTAPIGDDGKTVGVGDTGAQARCCFEIAGHDLSKVGAGWSDVVRPRLILVNIDNWPAAAVARKAACEPAQHALTTMQVSGFVNPEWLVEIEVDAVIGERS